VGFGPLQSVVSFALRPLVRSTGPAPPKRNRAASGPCGSASREVLAPSDTTTSGAPSPSRTSLRSSVRDEDRQTLVGAVLRVLAPLDGSGYLAARSRSFGPRRSPWTPTLRGLVPCRSRPWSAPPELSLPGEPYPLSRVFCFLAGSLSDCRRRSACRIFTSAFTRPRRLVATRAHPKVNPGLMRRDGGSLRSLVRSPRHT